MTFIKIALVATGALVAISTTASADFRYTGSPKQGEYYIGTTRNDPRATNPFDAQASINTVLTPVRKGGIGARSF